VLIHDSRLIFRSVLSAGLLLLTLSAPATSQTTGTIVGIVSHPGTGPLPGTTVTARQIETGFTRSVIADAEGRYTLAGLSVGRYEIRAEIAGFRPLVRLDVDLAVAETAVVDFVLERGELAIADTPIEVQGHAPLVNTQTYELSYLVSGKTLETLPLNGRNYTDLALLQPGVVAFPHRDGGSVVAHGLGVSVNGQDPRANVYLLDGTLQNDFTNGPAGSAAGTALGLESVREFRVEVNAYSAEFGRNSGGQINVLTKSGTNRFSGSAYEYHRNHALDARNYFDGSDKPDFTRNQFGGSFGGPFRRDRSFYFASYESLRERLGRTIRTFVPDAAARQGILPDPARPGETIQVAVSPVIRPYLDEYPIANGPALGDGSAIFTFPFRQTIDQNFAQGRVDHALGTGQQLFARYTIDDARQRLPTDYPQFPRSFLSRNQFFTGEYRRATSSSMLHTARIGFSRTRIGQEVEANTSQPLPPFVPGRALVGDIDVGGLQVRWGPQTSSNLRLVQNVFSGEYALTRTAGRHLIKGGTLVEHYQDNMVNPTFSLGIYTFPSLQAFLTNRPTRFLGLTPEAQIDRYWRFTLFGAYVQDEWRLADGLTLSGGLRFESPTMPEDIYGRDVSLPDLSAAQPTAGPLYDNPGGNISPRVGAAWDVFGEGSTSVRGGYGLYFNTNNHQNLIVTVTNPPATPRPIIPNPTFPTPSFDQLGTLSIRPVQWDIEWPRLHVYNLSVQRELPWETVVTLGYAGSRGTHLWRSYDANVPTPQTLADGTPFFPPTAARPNSSFSTIELKASDGHSWYNALIFEVRKRLGSGLSFQSSYTWAKNIDTTQASTFFSDSTTGTTTAFPESLGPGYNRGLADFHAKHNWVFNFTWEIPFARELAEGLAKTIVDGWQLVGIGRVRSGPPLTVFIANNWSRSRWSPSLGPGTGFDRPSFAPGRSGDDAVVGSPDQWFDPSAFVLQPQGTPGNAGRGALIGPDLRVLDLALIKSARWSRLGTGGRVEVRIEAFNVLNRTNFGPPSLIAFTGSQPNEQPLASFGRIRSTVTSSRQIQLGVRVVF
jgi:Carboxypeptidase regulatory-like domain/TonB dependent receptor